MKWKVKLGDEARPETVATRLIWAVGYQTDWDYFIPILQVKEMPSVLHRGQDLVAADGSVANVRLKREPDGQKKRGEWKWRDNPFSGTRELDGLRVMMALVNNWDLKDQNNAILEAKRGEDSRPIFEISDLGATFLEKTGFLATAAKVKAILRRTCAPGSFKKIRTDSVDFETPRRPDVVALVNPREFFSRLGLRWIGRRIPREDARWMGGVLAQLSPEQIRSAFRAGGYPEQEVDGFTAIVEDRIAQLNKL